MGWRSVWTLVAVAVILATCTQSAAPGTDGTAPDPSGAAGERQSQPARTLAFAVRFEAVDLAAKSLAGVGTSTTKRAFNAALALVDATGTARPYLAQELPQLNSPTWRVFPDGTMETTYVLKPNLTWHDGAPVSAEDFAFAWRVYAAPGLGMFGSEPQDKMEEVAAPDERTVRIRWRLPYPDAGALVHGHMDALPRHLLAEPFSAIEQSATPREVFAGLPFWSTEYIGLGPYRLDRWEPGSQIEAVAFPGHALGRPKIERIVIRIMGDENTVLSALLSENIHVATDVTLRYEHAAVLKREWERNRRGLIILALGLRHYSYIQFRPDYLKTPALLDVRVRRALAHAMDKGSLNEAFFDGQAPIDHSFVAPTARYFAEVDRAVMKYPYDPRRTEQLLNEAGFTKDGDGFFADAAATRLRPDLWTEQSPLWEKELALMIDFFLRAGVEVQPYVLPNRLVRDNEARATIPGIYTVSTSSDERRLEIFTSRQIGSPSNRWGGGNRGGWSNGEVDRLWDAFLTTLDRGERDRQIMQMMRIVSEQVPAIPLYFNPGVIAHLAVVRGPANETPESLTAWNIHEWELGN